MYQVVTEYGKNTGVDDDGTRRVLVDFKALIQNKSPVPIHGYTTRNGMEIVDFPWIELLEGRYNNLSRGYYSAAERTMRYAAECLIVEHLMHFANQINVALVDMEESDAKRMAGLVAVFEKGHQIIRMASDTYDIYRSRGFDLILLVVDEAKAESQVRLAGELLSDEGLLLCLAENAVLFPELLKLLMGVNIDANAVTDTDTNTASMCSGGSLVEEIEIGDGCSIYLATGIDMDRELATDLPLQEKLEEMQRHIGEILQQEGDLTDALRRQSACANHYAKEAQRQGDFKMKQAFLEFKEVLQNVFLFADDVYAKEYLRELEERCCQ